MPVLKTAYNMTYFKYIMAQVHYAMKSNPLSPDFNDDDPDGYRDEDMDEVCEDCDAPCPFNNKWIDTLDIPEQKEV
ncbi:MAG: hypothetical protein ACOH1N_14200 [Lutibacter sp.]